MSLGRFFTYASVFLQCLLNNLTIDAQLFLCYETYSILSELIAAFYDVCTHENIDRFCAFVLSTAIISFVIIRLFDSNIDNSKEHNSPGYVTPTSHQHNSEDASENELPPSATNNRPISSIIPPTQPPLTMPNYPPFEHLGCSGTGEAFLPRNRYKLKKVPNMQYPAAWKDTFLDEDNEKKYGFVRVPKPHCGYAWKYIGAPSKVDVAVPSAIEVPEVSRGPITAEKKPVEKVEAARPTHQVVNPPVIPPPASAPTRVSAPPVAPLAPPPSAYTQAPSRVPVASSGQAVSVLQAPSQVPAAAPSQHHVGAQPTREQQAILVVSYFAAKSGELGAAMQAFISSFPQGYEAPMAAICTLMADAHQALQLFFPNGLTAEQSAYIGWNGMIVEFWDCIRPHGYALQQEAPQNLKAFLDGVFMFAQYMGMTLQHPDYTPPPPPPPPPQQPPTYPVQQQTVPAMGTEGFQAPSFAAPVVPLAAPKASAPTQSQAAQPVSKGLDADKYPWLKATVETVNKLTKESFGWDVATLGQFSAAKDLVLSGSDEYWKVPSRVKRSLNQKATAFKRAAVILRMQGKAGNQPGYSSPPTLLNELREFVKAAGEKTTACGGIEATHEWKDLYEALYYFHTEIMEESSIHRVLSKQYGEDNWDLFENEWTRHQDKWFGSRRTGRPQPFGST